MRSHRLTIATAEETRRPDDTLIRQRALPPSRFSLTCQVPGLTIGQIAPA
jgi:hypothetical protein